GGRAGPSSSRYARSSVISAQPTAPRPPGSAVEGEFESFSEFGGHLGIGEGTRTRLRDDDEVAGRSNLGSPIAEDLSQQPLDTVADHRVTDPSTDRHAEPGPARRARTPYDHQVRSVTTAPPTLQVQEFATATDSSRLRIAQRTRHFTRAAS